MLKSIGIDAIKVEGRKKSSEYVYETVSYYDNILKGTPRPTESYGGKQEYKYIRNPNDKFGTYSGGKYGVTTLKMEIARIGSLEKRF